MANSLWAELAAMPEATARDLLDAAIVRYLNGADDPGSELTTADFEQAVASAESAERVELFKDILLIPLVASSRRRESSRAMATPEDRHIAGLFTYQSDMRPHFGLGDTAVATLVRIEWPSGIVQELFDVNADQILKVTEPPRLSIRTAGASAMLSWPARAEGYVLYRAASPDGPWEPVDAPVVVADHQATVEVSGGDSVRFYRLQLP
jgi:hypothetical protein